MFVCFFSVLQLFTSCCYRFALLLAICSRYLPTYYCLCVEVLFGTNSLQGYPIQVIRLCSHHYCQQQQASRATVCVGVLCGFHVRQPLVFFLLSFAAQQNVEGFISFSFFLFSSLLSFSPLLLPFPLSRSFFFSCSFRFALISALSSIFSSFLLFSSFLPLHSPPVI